MSNNWKNWLMLILGIAAEVIPKLPDSAPKQNLSSSQETRDRLDSLEQKLHQSGLSGFESQDPDLPNSFTGSL